MDQVWNKGSQNQVSWNNAADLCNRIGGTLPYFTSRKYLHQLIDILKKSTFIPLMEAIFITTKYPVSNVSKIKPGSLAQSTEHRA